MHESGPRSAVHTDIHAGNVKRKRRQKNETGALTSVFCKKSIASVDALGKRAVKGRRLRMGSARM